MFNHMGMLATQKSILPSALVFRYIYLYILHTPSHNYQSLYIMYFVTQYIFCFDVLSHRFAKDLCCGIEVFLVPL